MTAKTIFIVESKNDEFFIRTLVDHLKITDSDVQSIKSMDIGYECLGGLGSLKEKLKSIKIKIAKDGISKIGIILDQDKETKEGRLKFINDNVNEVFNINSLIIKNTNEFVTIITDKGDDGAEFLLSCHLIGVDDNGGELEDILKKIKTQPSQYADCLFNQWSKCVRKEKELTEKELVKIWVQFYIRYDTCADDEKSRLAENVTLKVHLKNKYGTLTINA